MDHSDRSHRRKKRTPKPLDSNGLRELAMSYVARFATTSGKLRMYLRRKLRERGWEGDGEPDVDALVEDFVARGFVDDAGWARDRAAGLSARGYGSRRIGETLRAAGISEAIRVRNTPAESEARAAAVRLARRKRFGPFGDAFAGEEGQKRREKQLAAMARAGHAFSHARKVVESPSEVELSEWLAEAESEEDGLR